MQRRDFFKTIGLLSGTAVIPASSVFANEKIGGAEVSGKVTDGKKGIAGVTVSDGFNVVQTGKDGSYKFTLHSKAEFVFVTVPSGYEIPQNNGIANFYKPVTTARLRNKADFSLNKLNTDDTKHAFIVWGDTQIETEEDAQLLKTISAPDTQKTVSTLKHLPLHGIGCGDLVYDKFELYKDYKEAVAITGIPFFQVIGNHDMDYTGSSDDDSQVTFKSHFGPTYYSFNRGKIHYVVLDNVFFIGTGHRYIGYLTGEQLAWLKKDLNYVAKGSTVVVSLHIPTNNGEKRRLKQRQEEIGNVTSNRQALYDLLKDYKVHIMSGHTHFNENWEEDNIMEHNHGTVCGAWWSGPVCGDGTPNGYGVYEVDGDELKWKYKSVGFEIDHQIAIYPRGKDSTQPGSVIANVWNWDNKWKVEWFEDGVEKGLMKQFTGVDPVAVELYKGPSIPAKHKWVEPRLTDHLFAATPSAAAKKITIKATDRFGRIYSTEMMLS